MCDNSILPYMFQQAGLGRKGAKDIIPTVKAQSSNTYPCGKFPTTTLTNLNSAAVAAEGVPVSQ